MTTIQIDDRCIKIRKDDRTPREALDRTLDRLYGAGSFMQPRNGERWQDGGATFRGWVDIYRSRKGENGAHLVASHVRINVW